MAPKDPINGERGKTFAPGELADGSVVTMTEDEAAVALGQREADEAAFDSMLDRHDEDDFEDDLDDLSDLDDEDEFAE